MSALLHSDFLTSCFMSALIRGGRHAEVEDEVYQASRTIQLSDCAVLMSLIVISRAKLRAFGIVLGKRRPSWVTLPNCLSLLGGICSDIFLVIWSEEVTTH